ncbi:hypothetical protein FALBO_602 [Fusarium albosuccineum]|uniref:Uncharacterized protein n=1 Tax=Fusarium albosuccineum TaxID=1237068 RepID=A0A8H4LN63_9HYPO|nr:hypothetical protein FALBO_602 [Fusarium albosuccineum]
MSAPTTARMPDQVLAELTSFVASFWPSQPVLPRAHFGHIRLPPYRPDNWNLRNEIHRSVSSIRDGVRLFFVVPEMEMDIISHTGEQFDQCPLPPVIMSFDAFLDSLRDSRRWVGPDAQDWEPLDQDRGEIFVVIHVDPTFPTDCSLALAALVNWAIAVSCGRGIVRVVTMSTDHEFYELGRLIAIRDPDICANQLDLAALYEQNPVSDTYVSNAGSHCEIADEILAFAWDNFGRPQTIISFEGEAFSKVLVELGREASPGPIESVFTDDRIMDVVGLSESLPNIRILEMDPYLPLPPMALAGETDVHIVLGSQYSAKLAWDGTSDAAPFVSVETSRDQRIAQLWWARQPHSRKTRVYTGGCDIMSFLEERRPRRRMIDARQMGGFVTSLVSMQSLGINARLAIWSLVHHPHNAEKLMDNLKAHGVISDMGLTLPVQEAVDFLQVLPLVKYDHRLALFVARTSTSDFVRATKIQVAALLTVGIYNVVEVENGAIQYTDDGVDLSEEEFSFRCERGELLGWPNVIWLSVGPWKHKSNPSNDPNDSQTIFTKFSKRIRFREPGLIRVQGLVRDMSNTLDVLAMREMFDDDVRDELENQRIRAYFSLRGMPL